MNIDELDEFTRAYLETALWSSNDGEKPLDEDHSIQDISEETLEVMKADCAKFQKENERSISDAIATGDVQYGPDFGPMGRAGHDFWLTRSGHGCGFWDGDWPEPFATKLTNASKAFGEVDLYVGDDGKLYI